MRSVTLSQEDWEAVCDALDRVGYHSIADKIDQQAVDNAEQVEGYLDAYRG